MAYVMETIVEELKRVALQCTPCNFDVILDLQLNEYY